MGKTIVNWGQSLGTQRTTFNSIITETGNQLSWEKEKAFALQLLQASEYLQKCDPLTIRNAMINVASVGLTLNPAEKLAYLIPRKGKCVLDISYRGLIKIATDSGSVLWAKALPVFKTDKFEFLGVDEKPIHQFDPFLKIDSREGLIGGYSIAKLSNGDYLVDTMTVEEINDIKDRSEAGKRGKGPWVTDYLEMVKKTLLRRGSKSWPHSQRFTAAEEILNEHQGINFEKIPEPQDAVLVVNDEQIAEMDALIKESHVNVAKILEAFGIEVLTDLPADEFAACKSRLEKALVAHNKKMEKKAAKEEKGKKDADRKAK